MILQHSTDFLGTLLLAESTYSGLWQEYADTWFLCLNHRGADENLVYMTLVFFVMHPVRIKMRVKQKQVNKQKVHSFEDISFCPWAELPCSGHHFLNYSIPVLPSVSYWLL